MKRTRRQKTAMALAIFLASLLLLGAVAAVLASLIPPAQAVTQADINRLKNNRTQLANERNRIKAEISKLKDEKADAVQQKIAIDQQINVITMEIENTSELISELTVAIAERQAELESAMAEEAEAYKLFRQRVRVMEEAGNATYLSILFESRSFSDLLDRWDMISEIVSSDRALMDDLAKKREAIDSAKLQLESDKAEQLENRRELGERQAELAQQYSESDQLIADLMDNIDSSSALEAENKALLDKYDKEIADSEAELKRQLEEARKKNSKYVGGSFGFPVPGYENSVTSPYGMRKHPILKVNRMHTGIDIGAPKNTKIVASNAGTVIVKTYNSSYGNYLVIDHGGGRSSLYAHQTKFASNINVGTAVSRGDVIGYVGSTGLSTGPHLHFEIRIDGEHKDPEDYLKAK